MGDPSIPFTPPPAKSNIMPWLYYGLMVIGGATLVFAICNLIILKCCSHGQVEAAAAASSQSFDSPNENVISSFKYRKEGSSREADNEHECAVCLSVFEEDEILRQLPRCKHSFHAPCIDMWLYSHLDCPLCRSPADPPFLN
ncbi:hypothetical protein ACH5RR_006195 [Cinchona calisaya]|uniref:RING-type domain-containing protein n=1 Tax=Cinchona calisaya TaxID=153742 RepID=A0ABD3AND0_9GENT